MRRSVVTWQNTGNPDIPCLITVNGQSTPVWLQTQWRDGPHAYYIQRNGCGHCCTAMAANLRGVRITPAQEYSLCLTRWGLPDMGRGQHHFISVSGIADILGSLGIPARVLGVPAEEEEGLAQSLQNALEAGRQVILWSHPSERLVPNPFSTGEHYVLAAGYDREGRIVIANSGTRVTNQGVQLVEMDTLLKALYRGAKPAKHTWGYERELLASGGLVIVG